jgi:hypothetical protein
MAEWKKPRIHRRPSSLQSFEDTDVKWLFHATRTTDVQAKWKITPAREGQSREYATSNPASRKRGRS